MSKTIIHSATWKAEFKLENGVFKRSAKGWRKVNPPKKKVVKAKDEDEDE